MVRIDRVSQLRAVTVRTLIGRGRGGVFVDSSPGRRRFPIYLLPTNQLQERSR